MNHTLALVSTLHDPHNRLCSLAEPFIDRWVARYSMMIIWTSPGGGSETGRMLAEAGAEVVEDQEPQGVDRMGNVRRRAIQAASGAAHLLLIDFDRLIHWERHYPEELRRVEATIPRYDFLILGRTDRAFESHPYVQRETERLANAAFARIFGQPWDIGGGARGLSAAASEAISRYSRCATVGVDGEWPVLCERLGLRVGYLPTEGLEYETADRFSAEIEALGYDTWLERHINSASQWEIRLRFAWQMAAATHEASERPLPPDPRCV